MVNALKALALLRDAGSLPLLEKVAREDPNLRVRDAARRAVEATRGRAAAILEHHRNFVTHGIKNAPDVRVENAAVFVFGGLLKRALPLDAGVVKRDI